ncbi:hypothetical protein GIS00_17405 [Nakamurella sp. YIM 132087]|uniref:Uncharacterized protein n=1 Tax=Nakamurella alba TaxID=2665158 RepID=A0A7K1FR42_9ACTN|nr:DUF6882 domain-containing protein [Nakamurella alba]MTD15713.1 hypothetical protein [Nakamurella alba]
MTAPGPTVDDLLDDAALLSLEHQLHLKDLGGPPEDAAVHLLGDADPERGTFRWVWADPEGHPPAATGLAEWLRGFGEQHGVPVFTRAEIPFAELPGSPADAHRVAATMCELAKPVSGRWTAVLTGDGTVRTAALLDHRSLELGEPVPARALRVLAEGLNELPITLHRRALATYGRLRGLQVHDNPDGSMSLDMPGLRAVVRPLPARRADFGPPQHAAEDDGTHHLAGPAVDIKYRFD